MSQPTATAAIAKEQAGAVMLRFVAVAKAMPEKREADARRGDFDEIYGAFDQDGARTQASRCSQCGIPFCQVHCPVQNNIPDWLKLTAEGRLEEAYEVSQATNTFPEICGRICPQDRLCEGNCVIEKGFESVSIGSVEKHITDTAWEMGWVKPPRPRRELPFSVGIVGGGPAGLAAADALRRKGYQVDVYDRHDRMGGLMIYGIPNFKLDKRVVERRTRLLADGGVRLNTGIEVGRDLPLGELRARHDAVLIATGVYKARELGVVGQDMAGVHKALDFLVASNRAGLGDIVPTITDGTLDARGKRVVVIGGGDTAMDCVRTAVRQGAASVTCLYRRDRANMPGSRREVGYAEEEGVRFAFLAAPEAVVGPGRAVKVKASRIHLGPPDASGRQVPEPIAGSAFDEPADMIIKALGFDPEDLPATLGAADLATTRWGTLRVAHPTFATNLDGVFAAGDIVRGASLVVWAIKDGRDAAESIHRHIQQRHATRVAAE
jgi:glutamate synthase (NADPH/NADH) small chain